MVQVYKIEAKAFLDISSEYPIFRRFLLLRATQRRTHFIHIFEDMKQVHELNMKKFIEKSEATVLDGEESD